MTARPHIENTLYRFGWMFAMSETEGLGACFTADAEVDFEGKGTTTGRDAVVAELTRRRSKYGPQGTMMWHLLTNVFIVDESDAEASVRTFFTAFVSGGNPPPTVQSIGYYDDLFALDDGMWRIRRRRVVRAATALAEIG